MTKLFSLYCCKTGQLYVTDVYKKVLARKRQLEVSQRQKYEIREEGQEKYRKPPCFNFDPSGDADKYRERKAKAKRR